MDKYKPPLIGIGVAFLLMTVLLGPILWHEYGPTIKPSIYDEMRDGLEEEANVLGALNFSELPLNDDPHNTTMRLVEYGGVWYIVVTSDTGVAIIER